MDGETLILKIPIIRYCASNLLSTSLHPQNFGEAELELGVRYLTTIWSSLFFCKPFSGPLNLSLF